MSNMESAVDFKKLMAIELQINLGELKNDSKFTFVTESALVEGIMNLQESDFNGISAPLGHSLVTAEREPKIDLNGKNIINVKACFYLSNVKLTPFSDQSNPIYLNEFVLFSDHILGVTLIDE
ncbi:hypothetical protein CEH05_07455 [Halobacillus halophilus]|uniref:Uncharacterized protein n=1 Tax=Halobacillus halophilus (strain ATCC 35676 / DSM 2266 / JCM 20832 / KCTC 3685 / LMG 17431 / NBRC 102448 / NCIMB 2269) TaxID=866895 RepID=I0JL14_HALH3|nr:hypothetical protein [Halobacillus halophilus]ASF38955.1 hypothetical protein CEH05_07455 [Halobacillus halophilus]CCG44834.1 hypothetical protein HBHAL_2490 [Halobacillus halophilus DSM 2266]